MRPTLARVTALSPDVPSPGKGERTREHIVETALRLFHERGYAATTMRSIATEANVSVGNAYYYFPSKQHLVQAYYDHQQDRHIAAARPALDRETDFAARLHGVLMARIDTIQSEKAFAVDFFRYAADPKSPLSPFSPESAPARGEAIALYAEALSGSRGLKMPDDLRAALPELLWLYQMGVVLFWVHDTSEGSAKTYALAARTAPLVAKMVNLARYRLLRGIVTDVLELVRDLRP